jgi:hypothetical protein
LDGLSAPTKCRDVLVSDTELISDIMCGRLVGDEIMECVFDSIRSLICPISSLTTWSGPGVKGGKRCLIERII